jgi:hypothetical protein
MAENEALARLKNAGRNDPCPCGSGKKYKKCHQPADEEAERKRRGEEHAAAVKEGEAKAAEEAKKDEGENASKPAAKPAHTGSNPAKPTGQPKGHKPMGAPRKMV